MTIEFTDQQAEALLMYLEGEVDHYEYLLGKEEQFYFNTPETDNETIMEYQATIEMLNGFIRKIRNAG